jgi:NAD(P)-dependent dehydrogenase (short-subunit alcohol dehydrogenase family)
VATAPDLSGRTCMITGASSGIGKASAAALAGMGASLVLVCRDRGRGENAAAEIQARTGNTDITLLLGDLSSQQDIRRLADQYRATGRPLHVLLNNAGVMMMRREETADGHERTFALNHLGYFLLTLLLLDVLKASAPARIVSVASDAHHYAGGGLDFDDLDSTKGFSPMRVYARSKGANILFTRELARRLDGTGVTANCLHPGFVGSSLATNNGWYAKLIMLLLRPIARSTDKGAETAIYLCSSPDVEGETAQYFFDKKPKFPKRYAQSDENAQRLWTVSEQMTGVAVR